MQYFCLWLDCFASNTPMPFITLPAAATKSKTSSGMTRTAAGGSPGVRSWRASLRSRIEPSSPLPIRNSGLHLCKPFSIHDASHLVTESSNVDISRCRGRRQQQGLAVLIGTVQEERMFPSAHRIEAPIHHDLVFLIKIQRWLFGIVIAERIRCRANHLKKSLRTSVILCWNLIFFEIQH